MPFGNPDANGNMGIRVPETPIGSRETVGTSAVRLTTNISTTGVNLKADHDNTGSIYIGFDDTVTTENGIWRLEATEEIFVPIDNANKLWVISDVAGQTLYSMGG